MKRISQNKFTSSLFSCLGVAACVAFSSCGKKDNDQFKNANEFAEFLKIKAKNENVDWGKSNLEKFANDNWETASKKNFQFTEKIKKQIAEEDPDNENEELNPDQEQPKTEQPNQGQQNTEQPSPDQSNPDIEQPQTSTADLSGTTAISDKKKLSELVSQNVDQHTVVKIDNQYFDLNVFSDLYSWIYKNANKKNDSTDGLVAPEDLTWEDVKKIVSKSKFKEEEGQPLNEEKKFGIKEEVSRDWAKENEIYTYVFTASSKPEEATSLECLCYNGLLKFWAQANDLGFSGEAFNNGTLKQDWSHCGGNTEEEQKKKINSVVGQLINYLKQN